jgi:hypothetical protein
MWKIDGEEQLSNYCYNRRLSEEQKSYPMRKVGGRERRTYRACQDIDDFQVEG